MAIASGLTKYFVSCLGCQKNFESASGVTSHFVMHSNHHYRGAGLFQRLLLHRRLMEGSAKGAISSPHGPFQELFQPPTPQELNP